MTAHCVKFVGEFMLCKLAKSEAHHLRNGFPKLIFYCYIFTLEKFIYLKDYFFLYFIVCMILIRITYKLNANKLENILA